jgi:hypothetical protein
MATRTGEGRPEGGAMGIKRITSDGGRRSSGKGILVSMLATGLSLLVLAPAGVGAQEPVSEADCEAAIQATAEAYESDQTPDPETEQLARDCTTPVSEGAIGETTVTTTKSALRGTSCRTIQAGYGYVNAFGIVFASFVGHLSWCYNGNKVQGGNFWITVDRCCHWFYEGVVHTTNGGCFGGCGYVYRHRMGSFVFNPPWPAITTRLQPWFALYANKNGGWWRNSGG